MLDFHKILFTTLIALLILILLVAVGKRYYADGYTQGRFDELQNHVRLQEQRDSVRQRQWLKMCRLMEENYNLLKENNALKDGE